VLAELATDRRLIMVLPGSMVMQVAHPVVGAGVGEHSVFRTDPWGRLAHSLESTMTLVRGGPAAAAEGARLREVHRGIGGVDERGRRYHALHPGAYAWVHLILFERLVTMRRIFGRPLTAPQRAALYGEIVDLGLAMGIRRHHMPADERAFWPYLAHVLDDVLEDHPTAHAFLDVLRHSAIPHPRWPATLARAWPPIGRGIGGFSHFLAVGTLPGALRARLGLEWTAAQERRLVRMGRGVARLP
jgi:uncharacterized protein (DUF2236 family)